MFVDNRPKPHRVLTCSSSTASWNKKKGLPSEISSDQKEINMVSLKEGKYEDRGQVRNTHPQPYAIQAKELKPIPWNQGNGTWKRDDKAMKD